MKYLIMLFGIVIVLCGVYMLLDPGYFFDLLEANLGEQWIFFSAIGGRLVLGLLLYWTANQSRYALFMKIFSYLVILAAIILMGIGQDKFQDLVAFILYYIRSHTLIATLIVIAFGAFLAYAYTGRRVPNLS